MPKNKLMLLFPVIAAIAYVVIYNITGPVFFGKIVFLQKTLCLALRLPKIHSASLSSPAFMFINTALIFIMACLITSCINYRFLSKDARERFNRKTVWCSAVLSFSILLMISLYLNLAFGLIDGLLVGLIWIGLFNWLLNLAVDEMLDNFKFSPRFFSGVVVSLGYALGYSYAVIMGMDVFTSLLSGFMGLLLGITAFLVIVLITNLRG
jgi:hypothetical protein